MFEDCPAASTSDTSQEFVLGALAAKEAASVPAETTSVRVKTVFPAKTIFAVAGAAPTASTGTGNET